MGRAPRKTLSDVFRFRGRTKKGEDHPAPEMLRSYCRGAFGGVWPGVLTFCGGGLVLPAAPARFWSFA